jgi:SAM-dependent methyltransferase
MNPRGRRTQRPARPSTADVVPSTIYDRDYLLSDRLEGFTEYDSGTISHVKQRELDLLDVQPGHRVLDLGCGRGEVAAELRRRGALPVAIDYSWAATELARDLLGAAAPVVQADATALPFASGSFDRILLGDVIEHIPWALAVTSLGEIRRVLAPGGRALIHTSPNTWFVKFVLPVLLVVLRLLRRRDVVAKFGDYNRMRGLMHPNELNPVSIRRLFREARVPARTWVDADVLRSGASTWTSGLAANPLVRLVAAVAARPPFRLVLGNDLYALVDTSP